MPLATHAPCRIYPHVKTRSSDRAIPPTPSATVRSTPPPIRTTAERASARPPESTRNRKCTTRRAPIAWSGRLKRGWAAVSTRRKKPTSTRSAFRSGLRSRDLDAVTREQRDQRLGMVAIARLDEELHLRAADRSRAEDALVLHFDDVAAGLGDQRRHLGEAARYVRHGDAQSHQARVAHQAAHQHRGEHAAVDVAAGHR